MIEQKEFTLQEIMNKLFCTFAPKEGLSAVVEEIRDHYTVLYDKIFILESQDTNEYLCTYNIDPNNSSLQVLPNTILLHRKKETNTLYTINALNLLIKELNGGVMDSKYRIVWPDFRNTVLLTQGTDLKKIQTKVYKVVESSTKNY